MTVKVKRVFAPSLDNRTMRLPAFDSHFREDSYQTPQQEKAYAVCRQHRRAIDAGAHVGYFSKNMVLHFTAVEAFEPDAANVACFQHNVPEANLHWMALGETYGFCRVVVDEITNSGAKHIELTDDGIPVTTIDSFVYHDVDLIKIDTQGYELPILKGAIHTIKHSHPVLCVEMPKRSGDPGIQVFLEDLGYTVVGKFTVDWVFVWDGI